MKVCSQITTFIVRLGADTDVHGKDYGGLAQVGFDGEVATVNGFVYRGDFTPQDRTDIITEIRRIVGNVDVKWSRYENGVKVRTVWDRAVQA